MKRLTVASLVAASAVALTACGDYAATSPIPLNAQQAMIDACFEAVDPLVPTDRGSSKWAQQNEGGWIVTEIPHSNGVDASAVVSAWWSPWSPTKDSQPWTVTCTVDYSNDGGKAEVINAEVGGI